MGEEAHPEGTGKALSAKMKDLITRLTNRSKRRLKLHQSKRERLGQAQGTIKLL